MKTITIEIENGVERVLTIYFSGKEFAGYGHYKLFVELIDEDGNSKTFYKTTTNMQFIDSLDESEGEVIFDFMKDHIMEEVIEWLS